MEKDITERNINIPYNPCHYDEIPQTGKKSELNVTAFHLQRAAILTSESQLNRLNANNLRIQEDAAVKKSIEDIKFNKKCRSDILQAAKKWVLRFPSLVHHHRVRVLN